jgi:hypothetical protein
MASRCTDIIVGTLKGSFDLRDFAWSSYEFAYLHYQHCQLQFVSVYWLEHLCCGFTGSTFLSFRPSEIAAAAALAAVSANVVVGFGSVLSAYEIPVNKVSFF